MMMMMMMLIIIIIIIIIIKHLQVCFFQSARHNTDWEDK